MSLLVSIRKKLSRTFTLETEFETYAPGECLGILGASGSGKSVTLKCIAGIESPDRGRISLDGRTLFDSALGINLKPQARRVGYLFQNYALFPRMTVGQNISAGLSRRDRDKVPLWIEDFGLRGLEGRYPHELSGGQQQRTALARMLVREPELILLDEPFSALDTNLREQMQIRFLELFKSRANTVMVTHSRDEAYRLCTGLLIMEEGRIIRRGETREVFARPEVLGAARITGCKNISPIRPLGGREVYALDWGIKLRLNEALPGDVTHIGIRAHDLKPAGNEPYNTVDIRVKRRASEPFEEVLIFSNAGAGEGEKGEIWWKFGGGCKELPKRLFIPPESLLLLR
jgi:molybdate transport system ATP-binding protein